MNCPKCRAEIEGDSKFCKNCGATVESATSPTMGTPSPIEAAASAGPRGPDPYRDPALEKQVWQGRPAWRAYFGIWMLWLIGSLVGLYLAHKYTVEDSFWRKALWMLIGASAIVLLVREALVILGQRYRLTTQRLFLHRGILTQVTDQLELVRVEDVRLRQGVIDRLVNTGDIEIISSDETDNKLVLQSVCTPAEVAEHVRRNVRGARGKGTLFVENV